MEKFVGGCIAIGLAVGVTISGLVYQRDEFLMALVLVLMVSQARVEKKKLQLIRDNERKEPLWDFKDGQ